MIEAVKQGRTKVRKIVVSDEDEDEADGGHSPGPGATKPDMTEDKADFLLPDSSLDVGVGVVRRSANKGPQNETSEFEDGGVIDLDEYRPSKRSRTSERGASGTPLIPTSVTKPSNKTDVGVSRKPNRAYTPKSAITLPASSSEPLSPHPSSAFPSTTIRKHTHSNSYHSPTSISSSAPLLLDWFESVREVRGMPWRKRWAITEDMSARDEKSKVASGDEALFTARDDLSPESWRRANAVMEQRGKRAYQVWVSEVMLQQTRVATVIPYWSSWMERWPDVQSLARADIEDVNSAWRGLGYYRRARSLLEGAKKIMENSKASVPGLHSKAPSVIPGGISTAADLTETKDVAQSNMPSGDAIDFGRLEGSMKPKGKMKSGQSPGVRPKAVTKPEQSLEFHGRLPDDATMMEKHIPGVGKYTAGAICSIAYGKRVPVVDGNIIRLFSRLLAIHLPSDSPALAKQLWTAAEEVLEITPCLQEEGKAGDWNQALMELGSQVCKPTGPDCEACCLKGVCRGYAETSKLPSDALQSVCTTCEPFSHAELNSSGAAITDVTIYPMRKASAKGPREESTAVCVLRWVPSASKEESHGRVLDGERWLFVKRPEQGLLAGLFEPPSVALPDRDLPGPDRLALCKAYIWKELLGGISSGTELASAGKGRIALRAGNYLGEYTHIFSHIKMTYHVHLLTLQGGPGVAAPPCIKATANTTERSSVAWLSEAEVGTANVGTGVKRIWEMVYGKESVWAGEDHERAQGRTVKKVIAKGVARTAKPLAKATMDVVDEETKAVVSARVVVRKRIVMPGGKMT